MIRRLCNKMLHGLTRRILRLTAFLILPIQIYHLAGTPPKSKYFILKSRNDFVLFWIVFRMKNKTVLFL